MSNPFETIEQKLTDLEGLILSLKDNKPEPKKVTYLTRQQAAELLHITLPTLHEYTKAGVIQGSRIGTRVLYSEQAIQDAVKAIPVLKYKRTR